MRAEEIKGLMEAYSKVHETPEVLNEEVVVVQDILGEDVEILDEGIFGSQDPKSGVVGQVQRLGAKMFGDASAVNRATSYEKSVNTLRKSSGAGNVPLGKDGKPITAAQIAAETKRRRLADPNYKAGQGVDSGAKPSLNKPAPKDNKPAPKDNKPAPKDNKGAGDGSNPSPSGSKPAAPVSQTVLAKKGGVEGKLDKATGKFTAGNFSDAEKARYSAASQKSEVSKGMNQYNKDKAAISTAKTPEAKAAATKTAEKSGMAVSQAKFGKDFAKPKTPNPLMKDMPGQNKAELDQIRGNAALNSISKSSNAAKIMKTSPIAKQSLDRSAASLEAKPAATPAPKPVAATPTPEKKPQPKPVVESSVDLFDIIKGHLLDEGYAETEEGAMVIMVNMSEEWRESIIMELTGGKGHPGYKAGSKDHGDLEDHPAVKKGGVLTPRHGEHLGDLDDEDDEEDELENILKDRSRARREAVRKPLRDKVKAARKKMTKEGYAVTIEDIVKLLDENREHDREMRRAAARERAEEKKEKKEEGKKSAKTPGRLGKSAGSSYADYQEVSIKAHDKATKGKFIPGMVKNEGYQRDPEKDEKEDKKYEKVRGEKTPMPPRGDKRREDFEKWYAKQMGR